MENIDTSGTIAVKGIFKSYGKVQALAGVDLSVAPGTILALLGPNGAGKTTLVHILTTLIRPDSGEATVAGFNVVRNPNQVRQNIGLTGQYAAIDENLTGRENLVMVGRLHHLGKKEARKQAAVLLRKFDLVDAADRHLKTYSGGMRRRLDLASSLVANPKVLFLDEPTTGLDPRSRVELWEVLKEIVSGGTTLLLTTQYLDEADYLADRIAVIDHGRLIAEGTSKELKARMGGDVIELHLVQNDKVGAATSAISHLGSGAPHVDAKSGQINLPVTGGTGTLTEVIRTLDKAGIEIADIVLRRPSLDEVFLALTGRK